jgi:thiol-disulfide isomerase/thioredoxin
MSFKSISLPIAVVFIAVTFILGCSSPADDSVGDSKSDSDPKDVDVVTSPDSDETADTKDVGDSKELLKIQPVSKSEFDEFVSANAGKVIVVDFWATWCEPCRKAFPHTVELANKYAESDIVVVSMSFDKAESHEKAAQFVTDRKADAMTHFISSMGMTESFDAYDIKEGIPEYRIFDKMGKQRYVFRLNAEGDDEPVENLDIRIREVLDE